MHTYYNYLRSVISLITYLLNEIVFCVGIGKGETADCSFRNLGITYFISANC